VTSQPGAISVGCSQIGSVNIFLRSCPPLVTMGMNGTLHPGIGLSKGPAERPQGECHDPPGHAGTPAECNGQDTIRGGSLRTR
jgi:hypothetical protein